MNTAMQNNVAQVIRATGRLVVNPTGDLASDEFPYEGTALGLVRLCVLQPLGESLLVEYEGLGAVGAITRGSNWHTFACTVRGWNDTAIEELHTNEQGIGAQTGRRTMSIPGSKYPGARASTRQVKLLFAPDDVLHVPAVLMYAAVPNWDAGITMQFDRKSELGLPLSFGCMQDSLGRVLSIGRLSDLEL